MVLLAGIGPVREVVPGLGLFTGPLGPVLIALAAAVAILRGPGIRAPHPPTWLLFVVPVLVLSAVGVRYVGSVEASGDEVDYLLMAQSIWREGDVDLRDNFRRGDFREYVPGVRRMPGGTRRADGRSYPTHSPGFSFLIAPVYALGGRAACAVFLSLVAAGLGLLARRLARMAGADEEASHVAWAAAVGPPVFFYTHFLYTEVVCAFLVALALRLLLSSPGAAGAAAAALALAALPWLHVKMGLVALGLGGFALARLRGRARLAFVLTAAVMAAAYLGYYWAVFGHLSPLARYGSRVPTPMARMTPGRTLLGVFLDGGFGLLPYAPVFLLGLAGLGRLLGSGRDRWAWAVVTAAVLVPVLGWKNWWGFSPPARFLVPLVPVLAVAAAVRVARRPTHGLARWRLALLAAGFGLALLMSAQPREMRMINGRDGPLLALDLLGGEVPPGRYLPRLTSRLGTDEPPWRPPASEGRVALVWAAAILLLLGLDRVSRSRPRVDQAFRGLGLPVAMLLALTVAVDRWARAGEPPGRSGGRPTPLGADELSCRVTGSCSRLARAGNGRGRPEPRAARAVRTERHATVPLVAADGGIPEVAPQGRVSRSTPPM